MKPLSHYFADAIGLLLIAAALYVVLWCYPIGQRREAERRAVEMADDVQTAGEAGP